MIQRLEYDKDLVKDERKKVTSIFVRPSTHELLMQFCRAHGFEVEDALVEALLEYNQNRLDIKNEWPEDVSAYYKQPGNEITVAIASDPQRELNKRKLKHGRPLIADRHKVFQVGTDNFPAAE